MEPNESSDRPRARARPKRHAEEADLELHQREARRMGNDKGVTLPADVPVHLRCFRLMEDVELSGREVMRLGGWTVELDAYGFGVKVYLRVGRDGSMKLICEDKDGREKLVEWGKD